MINIYNKKTHLKSLLYSMYLGPPLNSDTKPCPDICRLAPNDKRRPRLDGVAYSTPDDDGDSDDEDEPRKSNPVPGPSQKSRPDRIEGREWGQVDQSNIIDDANSRR